MFADRTNWNLTLNRLSEALARHRAAGKPILDLTVSNPTECGFVYDKVAILEALRNPQALKYEPSSRGLMVARQAVCDYYAEHDAALHVDDIVLTTSTSEAYSLLFKLLADCAKASAFGRRAMSRSWSGCKACSMTSRCCWCSTISSTF